MIQKIYIVTSNNSFKFGQFEIIFSILVKALKFLILTFFDKIILFQIEQESKLKDEIKT